MATKKVAPVEDNDKLSAQEEKVLDWVLNGIVVFVLAWLGLGILLSLGGLIGLWK